MKGTEEIHLRKGFGMFCMAAGAGCCLYFFALAVFTGFASKFNLIWLPMGLIFLGTGIFLLRSKEKLPKGVRKALLALLTVVLIIFLNVGGLIISGFFESGDENLDYVIVLGAQMKENGPSLVLKARLDAAIEYLDKNPETKVVVSGGKGSDELMSEAEGMKRYLENHGIAGERIFMEDKSVNTNQNLKFSAQYINMKEDSVGIVTSNFHIYRSVKVAKKQGYENVCGISAPSHPFLLPANMLRECACVIYYSVTGDI